MIKSAGRLTYTSADGVLTLKLTGEIDHHSAVGLREEADRLIYLERPKKLLLDLSGIDFMDSSGLGFIMGRYALVSKLGGSLALLNPNARVSRILSLSALERIIKTERTDEQ